MLPLNNEDLFEAVQLFYGFTQTNELVVESCYLYCFAIRLLIVDNLSKRETFERVLKESDRRARVSGCSTIQYWIDSEVNEESEMP